MRDIFAEQADVFNGVDLFLACTFKSYAHAEPYITRAFQGEGQYVLVIPIVFMEFMTVMLAAGVLPQLEYDYFGSRAVLVGGLVR